MTSADEFLAAATKEYEEGHIEPTLWARASAQSGNDELLVIAAYLRARATALRLEKRDKRRERRASRAKSTQDTRSREDPPGPRSEIVSATAVGVRLRGVQLKPKHAAVAAALASVVAAVCLIASPPRIGSSEPLSVSAVAPHRGSAPTDPVGRTEPVVGSASREASKSDSVHGLEATVQQLKDTRNWNVLVLYASKWTRDQPNNASAWSDLSIGYANLRQFDDALVAATKAVELSPGNASLWRNIGHLNMTLERLPEAGSAFDRALAMSSDDADALCGAASVAHKLGRKKEADAIAQRIKSAEGSCPALSDGESLAVAVPVVPATKPASAVRR